MTVAGISVIIAAHNCSNAIDRAIGSALHQPQTAEVIVVDDASSDDTLNRVEGWAQRENRVRVICVTKNAGPANARNRAIGIAQGDMLAILDSDDFFAPGRLAHLLQEPAWDMAADNVVFVRESAPDAFGFDGTAQYNVSFNSVDTATFVRGNMRNRRRARGEMGFLKPLLRRSFLEQHGLRYDPSLRLGEDYDLYMRMLLAGARFKLTARPGYGAVVRGHSLSAQHATQDLYRLEQAMAAHLALADTSHPARAAMMALMAEVRTRHDHRHFLDLKKSAGIASALRFASADFKRLGSIVSAVAADKLRLRQTAADPFAGQGYRLLMPLLD